VPEQGASVVTVVVDGQSQVVRLAPGSEEQAELDRLLGSFAATGETFYEPEAMAVFAAPAGPVSVEPLDIPAVPAPTVMPWPLDGLAEGCAVVRGPELERLLPAAGRAHVLTRWRSGSRLWAVAFRPLVPGEESCADVASSAAR
jgi:hypothetical protein